MTETSPILQIHTMEADGIQLSFGARSILSDIYIRSDRGRITGLLGRNGQGKTSLMRIIYGDLRTDSRSVRFDRRPVTNPGRQKELIRYLPQFDFIPGFLRITRVLEDFELDEPFTHLMPLQIEKVKDMLQAVKEHKGILLTDHLYQHVLDIADGLYVLADGRTHPVSNPEEITALGYLPAKKYGAGY